MLSERYYLIATSEDRPTPFMVVPLIMPVAHNFAHAYVANDAEAMSLARSCFLDLGINAQTQLGMLYMGGVDHLYVAATQQLLRFPDGSQVGGDTPAIRQHDLTWLSKDMFRIVAPVSGVPLIALPEPHDGEVGSQNTEQNHSPIPDPEHARTWMEQGLAWHADFYPSLQGYGHDRFVETTDRFIRDLVEWCILLNQWGADNEEGRYDPGEVSMLDVLTGNLPDPPLLYRYMSQVDDMMEKGILLRGRIENALQFKRKPTFVQDVLGGVEHDWDALLGETDLK